MLPTKFQVKWHFGSEEEAKNRFSKWPSWIFDRNEFSYFFLSTSHRYASYEVSNRLAFWLRRRSENRFLKRRPWRPCWISDWNDFSFSFIYVSPCYFLLSSKSIGLLVQEKKQKIYFQDGRHYSYFG